MTANLIGQKFERLTVTHPGNGIRTRRGYVEATWICKCDCGRVREVRAYSLTSGNTRSCGCLRDELINGFNRKHGQRNTKAYKVWADMQQRCFNPRSSGWKWYGARGITVCERWRTFENFYEDMGDPPRGLTIDRINNDGNYEPDNCRWATPAEQVRNQRPRNLQREHRP